MIDKVFFDGFDSEAVGGNICNWGEVILICKDKRALFEKVKPL